jgi:PEP-CTERM motif-containing protein
LPSSDVVAPGQPNPFSVPFAFNGHVVGFRSTDVDARTPLFDVTLTGRGTAFSDFEQERSGVFTSDIFRFTFEATPAATPEPATLALLGTGLFGLFAHARRSQRHD